MSVHRARNTAATTLVLALTTSAAIAAPATALTDAHALGVATRPASGITMLDLGTLGGPTSEATAVNESAQVVGHSTTVTGETHAFLWQRGAMTDLGTLGGPTSQATTINNRGQVIGTSTDIDGNVRAFIRDHGVMRDLGTPKGGSSFAHAINARGQVLGTFTDATGLRHSFVWERGIVTVLGDIVGARDAWATALNDRGEVVGTYETVGEPSVSRGWLWRAGTRTDLPSLVPGGSTSAADIDNRGQVAGTATAADGTVHVVRWHRGRVTDLGGLGGDYGSAAAVNERGTITGSGNLAGDVAPFHAFIARRTVTDLGSLNGPRGSSSANDVNIRDEVIGSSSLPPEEETVLGGTGFLWRAGTMLALPRPAGTIAWAVDVNDRGLIAGAIVTGSGVEDQQPRAALWRTR
jgi:probable HAF family extracellular repeat protein